MADEANENSKTFHLEGGIPVFERLAAVERKTDQYDQDEKRYKQDQTRIQKRIMWFTLCLVATSAVTNGLSYWQASIANRSAKAATQAADAAHTQVSLMRQQLVASEAAVMQVEASWDAERLGVNITNVGHSIARDFHVTLDVWREALPVRSTSGSPLHFEAHAISPIVPTKMFQQRWTVPWEHNQSVPAEWPKGWPGKNSVRFLGTMSYNNGFERSSQNFCFEWAPPFIIRTGQQSGSGGGMLVRCDDYEGFIAEIQRQERVAEQVAQHIQPK